jgi:hypothetical protein
MITEAKGVFKIRGTSRSKSKSEDKFRIRVEQVEEVKAAIVTYSVILLSFSLGARLNKPNCPLA